MSSLAEELRSRHLESQGEAQVPGSQAGGQPGAVVPSGEQAQGERPDAARDAAQDADENSAQDKAQAKFPGKPSSNGHSTSRDKFADLPQLKSSAAPVASPVPRSWGQAVQGNSAGSASHAGSISSAGVSSAASSGTSSANGSSRSSPRISSAKQSLITVAMEIPEDRAVVLEAVRSVSREFGVKIEIGKSAIPRNATFMIRGASATKTAEARDELQASFEPRETIEFEIPSSARAAVIGQRGSTLRALESKYKVSVELSSLKSTSAWSLERSLVTISGRGSHVLAAREAIMELIQPTGSVSSSRKLPKECAMIVRLNEKWGPFVDATRDRISLRGTYAEVIDNMAQVDALLGFIEADYVRRTVSADKTLSIPAPVARDLLEGTAAVVLTDSGEVFGPKDSIDAAVAAIDKFMKTQIFTQLDIAQAHGRDVSHARMLARYLAAKGEIERIATQSRGSVVISAEPAIDDRSVVYTFSGEEKAVSRARAALKNAVNARSPSSIAVVRGMRHPLVRKRATSSLKSLKGPVTGFIGPSDELYLEYCEPEDDFALSEEEIKQHILEAQELLSPLTELANSLSKKKISMSESDLKLALNPRGPEATELWTQAIAQNDVELETAASNDADADEKKGALVLNGTKTAVNEAAEAIPTIVQLSRQHAVLASHIEEIVIDPTLVRNLIGKGGSQIQKFRDEFDVKVDVDDAGHVRIQGVEAQAKSCSKAVAEMQRRLRDETTERLVVPVAFHAKLIGPRGKHVRRLSEQHQCVIKFPKARQESVESADSDSPSGVAGSEANFSDDADEDFIFIRGPSRGVAAIKREFMDLVNYEKAQSYTEELSVPGSVVSRLVGRGGVGINQIRHDSGANIDVGTANSNEEDVKIVVTGEPKAVKSAVSQLRKSADTALDHTEKHLDIPQEFHRFLTGPQNSIRRQLVSEAGGDAENAAKILVIPPQHSTRNPSQVRLSGPSSVVAKLEAQVLSIVEDAQRHSKEQDVLEVSRNRLRHIVGAEGQKKKLVEKTHDVYIEIPRSHGNDDSSVAISVRGETKESVANAIENLRELALPSELVVEIPAGAWSQKLRTQVVSKYKARVEPVGNHANATGSPKKPSASNFLLVPQNEAGTVRLRVSAKTDEDCGKAAEYVSQLTNFDTLGYVWLERSQFPAVIGTSGKTIKKIRTETGCAIEVPQSSGSAPIVITGPKQKVEAAKDAVIEAAFGRNQ